MSKKRKPEIRFKGFEDEWEERKLEDITTRIVRKNQKLESTLPLTISSLYGLVDQTTYFNNRIASRDVSNYYLIKKGEFAYNKSFSDGFPWGSIKRLERYEMGVLSTLYIVFMLNENNVDSEYLVSYFNTDYWHKEVALRAAEGARNHGLLNISAEDFFDTSLKFPKDKDEQSQVGLFFKILDNQLALQQTKHEKLKILKKSMLEKLFPKGDETVPEIRFAGFDNAWVKRKSKDIFKPVSDKGYLELPILSASQEYGMIRRLENGINIHHDVQNEIGYKKVLPGQFVIHLRSFQGGFAHSTIEGITSPAYTVLGFQEKEKHNDYFWRYIFNSESFIKRLQLITYGIRDGRSISFEDFSTLYFYYPSYEEQKQIGLYFQELDNLITLQSQRLEKLKNIKAACLEKMFV